MKISIALVAVLVAGSLAGAALASSHEEGSSAALIEAAKLEQLFADFFEENLELNPILATSIGDPRYNGLMPNFLTPEARAAGERFDERWLAQIRKIDRELLSGQDRLSYDIFVYNREISLEGNRFPQYMVPINQMFGLHSFFAQLGSGGSIQPFSSEKDYRDFLERIAGFGPVVDQAIVNMREGVEAGVVQPRQLMEKVLPQLQAHMVDEVTKSVFYRPITNMPEEIEGELRDELTATYAQAIERQLIPAYTRLHDFIRDEYLDGCRDTVALAELPDGKAWYAYQVKTMTTTELTPPEIHQFGLDEVARIHSEMRQVMADVGFDGELPDFFEFLEQDDRFYFTKADELVQAYSDLRDEVNAVLPQMFDVFPKTDYEVKPVPDYMAESSAGAFYQPGTPDGSRPGVFFINTYNLRAQPKFLMRTLSIHEAAPGHHFQISIGQEVESIPSFRRFGGGSAYFEGWALYAESLGKSLGLLDDPYDYYGRLSDELLRAMRLVVDTGLHDKGWSREQAIEYMVDNSSMAESDVVAEVERYIVFAGQALAYKVGQRVISELRSEAEAALGDDFDIKAFHRAVLIDGALPLNVLRTKMGEWLTDEKATLQAER